MKREVFFYRKCNNGDVEVIVHMDKEMVEELEICSDYAGDINNNQLGFNSIATCVNITKQIVEAAEEESQNE